MAKKRRSLINSDSPLAEEQTMQARLRAAVFDGVSEGDVAEVVQGITKRAKDGDPQALKYFFEYVLGGKLAPQNATQNNFYLGSDDDEDPEDQLGDAADRLEVMSFRAARGLPLNGGK